MVYYIKIIKDYISDNIIGLIGVNQFLFKLILLLKAKMPIT